MMDNTSLIPSTAQNFCQSIPDRCEGAAMCWWCHLKLLHPTVKNIYSLKQWLQMHRMSKKKTSSLLFGHDSITRGLLCSFKVAGNSLKDGYLCCWDLYPTALIYSEAYKCLKTQLQWQKIFSIQLFEVNING